VTTFAEFQASIPRGDMPQGLTRALRALWTEARGNWHEAHRIAQDGDDAACAWVHAYLHRKEGDHANAGYWYARAGQPVADASFEWEWEGIVRALLAPEA
jgi:hypothetical protein